MLDARPRPAPASAPTFHQRLPPCWASCAAARSRGAPKAVGWRVPRRWRPFPRRSSGSGLSNWAHCVLIRAADLAQPPQELCRSLAKCHLLPLSLSRCGRAGQGGCCLFVPEGGWSRVQRRPQQRERGHPATGKDPPNGLDQGPRRSDWSSTPRTMLRRSGQRAVQGWQQW